LFRKGNTVLAVLPLRRAAAKPIVQSVVLALMLAAHAASAETVLKVDAAAAGTPISQHFYGLMTEEINYSYDGGLYAELVRNRVFKDDDKTPVHWSIVQPPGGNGAIALDSNYPVRGTALTTALRLDATGAAPGRRVGVANDGYWGIPVKPNTTYRASFYARVLTGGSLPLRATIESGDGATVYASATAGRAGTGWTKYTVRLKTGATVKPTVDARFVLSTEKAGILLLNQVSLFPPTFKDRPNGLRPDLMKMMADMRPTFVRLPGGNYLEGNTVATRFQWKETLGPIEQRPGHMGTWKYRSSDGMGLMEFLTWTEDIGAEPLLAVFAGYALKGETIPAGPALQPFVDEALDEIEYLIGDVKTKWGGQRAMDGHPAPFKLTYVEIGNEDGFDKQKTYDGRYTQFHDAIKARYPHLKLISTVNGKDELGQRQHLSSRVPDLIDEHFYFDGRAGMEAAHRYDTYDRTQPKILVGEWATRAGAPTTNMLAALGDAAFMTGMERNADIIKMASYAPLFVNVNPGGMQWRSNLIGYNGLTSYGSPSYHAQAMFSEYLGTTSLPLTVAGMPTQSWTPNGKKDQPPPQAKDIPAMYVSATRDEKKGELYLKIVNTVADRQPVRIRLDGVRSVQPTGRQVVLAATSPDDTNSIAEPTRIVPVASSAAGFAPDFDYVFAPYSVTVLAIRVQ
jgi:alpha-N-arabinofuranosidase